METDQKVCLHCGAWSKVAPRGLSGQPFRLMVLRRLIPLLALVWAFIALAGFTDNADLGLILGFLVIPMSILVYILAFRSYQAMGVWIAMASFYGFIVMAILGELFSGMRNSGFVVASVATGMSLLQGWQGLRLYRLPAVVKAPHTCATCHYLLIGLRGNRCPECGTKFDPRQVARSMRIHGHKFKDAPDQPKVARE